MKGKRHFGRIRERASLEEAGNSGATCSIRLENIDRFGGEHPAKIICVIPIFAGRDVHPGRSAVAQQMETIQIIRGDWLLEPSHTEIREFLRLFQRLFAGVRSVCIHEEFDIRSDGFPRRANTVDVGFGVIPNFHFDHLEPLGHPAEKLRLEFRDGVAGESSAAIDRSRVRVRRQAGQEAKAPSSFAFKSHIALSTAAMAIDAIPGRPKFRILWSIAA